MIIIPLLLIGGGSAAMLAAILSKSSPGEPAEPVPMPDDLPATPPMQNLPAAASPEAASAEVEALARVIASEAGSGTSAEQRGIGWTVRNRFAKKSIYDGEYPWRSQKGSNPPFSSARDASEAHRTMARAILSADQSQDPTRGATSFFEPRMQDIFFKAGEMARNGQTGNVVIDGVKLTDITRFKDYKKNAAQIREKWGNGSTLYAVAGRFEFWGSAPLFAKRGGTVQTIVAGNTPDAGGGFEDIPDPLTLLPKYKGRKARKG